jgi:hypothetical protein
MRSMLTNFTIRICACAVLFFARCTTADAQILFLDVKVRNQETGKGLNNCEVTVYKDSKALQKFTSKRKDSLSLQLQSGFTYDVKFELGGFLSKTIRFETHFADSLEVSGDFRFAIDVNLLKKPEGFNEELTKEPIGLFKYNLNTDNFESDQEYFLKQKNRLDIEFERLRQAKNCGQN